MKKIYLFLIALLLTVSASAQTTIKGDVNGGKEEPDARAIDLGLSVKWASCNVGATAPKSMAVTILGEKQKRSASTLGMLINIAMAIWA